MQIICIAGKAGSGKDTVAKFMKEWFENHEERVLITHFADPLKFVCEKFFDWDGKKDKVGREMLQYVGTDRIRGHNPDFWVMFIREILEVFEDEWDFVLIPDCRFPNEYEVLADKFNTTLVEVYRPQLESNLTYEQQKHSSETAMDYYNSDIIITNDRELPDLKAAVSLLMESWWRVE